MSGPFAATWPRCPNVLTATAGARIPHMEGDPLFPQVLVLVNGAGAANPTTNSVVDLSSYAHSITENVNFYSSADIALPNLTTSLTWDNAGTGDRITFGMGAEYSGHEWCWECYFSRRVNNADFSFLMAASNGNLAVKIDYVSGQYVARCFFSGGPLVTGTTNIPIGGIHHMAMNSVDAGGGNVTISLWLDGVLQGTNTQPAAVADLSAIGSNPQIGGPVFANVNYYMPAMRITLASRYTAPFTPGYLPFPTR